jgi:hypothetical protein
MMYRSEMWVGTHEALVLWEGGGTQYDMYTANWAYGTCILVLDIQIWPRGDVPSLGLTDGDVDLIRGGGWIVTSLLNA